VIETRPRREKGGKRDVPPASSELKSGGAEGQGRGRRCRREQGEGKRARGAAKREKEK